MHGGYVKLWRKSRDSAVWSDPDLWRLWTLCLMLASHKESWVKVDGIAKPVKVCPGQFITGRFSLHAEMYPKRRKSNPSASSVWRWLDTLKTLGNLNIETNKRFSLITIINWHAYQTSDLQNEQPNEPAVNSRWTAGGQPVNTFKNGKKGKNGKKEEQEYSASATADAVGSNGSEPCLITKRGKKLAGKRLTTFLQFWEAFGLKKGKAEAAQAWLEIPELTDSIVSKIIQAAKAEAERRPQLLADGRTPKWPQGWLTGRRWEDEDYSGGGKSFIEKLAAGEVTLS